MIQNCSRRKVLQTSGLLGTGLILGFPGESLKRGAGIAKAQGNKRTILKPNVFLSISSDNQIKLVCHRSEMGQGVRTSMPMLIAEELEVSLDKVNIVQGEGDAKYGDQNTDGSTSARLNWQPLREAGAAAKMMLIAAAAKKWSMPESKCVAEDGHVYVRGTNTKLSYGALVTTAAKLKIPAKIKLKSRKNFKLIGKMIAGVDVEDITRGQAKFGIDQVLPGMLYASLERSPTVGGLIKSFDSKAALAVKGVLKVERMAAIPQPVNTNNAIAVIASHSWAANEGRKALKAQWKSPRDLESSTEFNRMLDGALKKKGKVYREVGDFASAKKKATKMLTATYHTPYLVHAPMEPMSCIAWVKRGSCEIWAPTQDPQRARKAIQEYLKIPLSKVRINISMLGGGFGRKSQPDFVLEAVALSKKLGKPVKITWTREDEVKHGFYHAEAKQRLTATLSKSNKVTGWEHKSAFPTILKVFNPKALSPAPFEMGMGAVEFPYQVPNIKVEAGLVPASVRIGWLRSVCHVWHSFAVNSFMDEIATELGRDPIDYRLALLGKAKKIAFTPDQEKSEFKFDTKRMANVTELVRSQAKWGRKFPKGRGQGFANHFSFFSYAAAVVDASVKDGQIKVNRVDCAVDCGTVINPDAVIAQVEGAIIFGLSAAIHGKISLNKGVVEQGNFDTYPVLRLSETPEMNIKIVESTEHPTGIGEPGVPPIAPALCGALYKATGKRQRNLPLIDAKLA